MKSTEMHCKQEQVLVTALYNVWGLRDSEKKLRCILSMCLCYLKENGHDKVGETVERLTHELEMNTTA